MTHLTMEQLLALREPGLEPGVQAWRDHVDGCEACRGELDRLDQRIARLRALPVLKPARNRFSDVQAQTGRLRFRRRLKLFGGSALGLAATVAMAVVLVPTGEQASSRSLVRAAGAGFHHREVAEVSKASSRTWIPTTGSPTAAPRWSPPAWKTGSPRSTGSSR